MNNKVRKYKIYGFKNGKKVFLSTFNTDESTLNDITDIIKHGFKENTSFFLEAKNVIANGSKWDAFAVEKCFFQSIMLLIKG